MNFEQAEALLSPAQRAHLAECFLENLPLPAKLSEAQRVFFFGLSVLAEYEDTQAIRAYLEAHAPEKTE